MLGVGEPQDGGDSKPGVPYVHEGLVGVQHPPLRVIIHQGSRLGGAHKTTVILVAASPFPGDPGPRGPGRGLAPRDDIHDVRPIQTGDGWATGGRKGGPDHIRLLRRSCALTRCGAPPVSDYQKVALSVLLINSILNGMLLLHRLPVELSQWHRLETVGDGCERVG